MTHQELVDRAGRWLLNTKRCKFVAINRRPWSTSEHPDAIGWLPNGESIVVECKVSLEDFRADHYKAWRKQSKGMGFLRYYMVPAGLLVGKGGRNAGSGVLECHKHRVKLICEAEPRQDRGWSAEIAFLVAQLSNGRNLIGQQTKAREGKDDRNGDI